MHLPIRELMTGQAVLVFCCFFYLAWWSLVFRPGAGPSGWRGGALLLLMVASALAGVYLSVDGVLRLGAGGWLSLSAVGGIAAYLALLAVTAGIFHRQPTTELLLIVAWAALEASLLAALAGASLVGGVQLAAAGAAVGVATLTGLACYLMYYRLEEMAAFYCGMVPLALDAACMAVMTLLLWRLPAGL